jgi:4-hydroxy-4-methyl-2-oxoglutarate aldolase
MALNGLLQRALDCGASTVYEAGGGVGALDPAIRPVWRGAMLCGPAFPVMCAAGDNLAVHRALERCESGDVLVITAGGEDSGYLGEVLANAAQARGVRGAVVDGGVRDIDALERMQFPAFARWISMRRTVKREPGEIGEPVLAGGVVVSRGSIVVADSDGVFVSDPIDFEQTVVAAEARVAREAELIRRIKAGELTLDLLGLRPARG